MSRPPRALTPWESELHFFGAELRHWRMARGLSQNGLGLRTHDSGSLMGKIEKAERFPSRELARRLDEALATGGVLDQLWPQVEQERRDRTAATHTLTACPESIPAELGLVWCADTATTVEVVGKLWRADMQRRSVLLSAAWVASAFADPVREWLLNRQDELLQDRPGRAVGRSDIDALWMMSESFTDADQRLGGGYARSTLIHYVNQVVLPLLNGSYNDAIGRDLMTATARLCTLCGFTSFDSGIDGLAQRYFIQALRLAKAGGNRELGAGILADMSMQAHDLGNATQAVELATAGYHTALDCGALSTAARCAAHQGEAYALQGDHRASAQARALAERTLDRAVPTGERTWVKLFTPEHMAAETLYIVDNLGQHSEIQRLAPGVLADAGGMQRRRVKCLTILASSYLPMDGNPHSDVDQACELLGQTLPVLGSLHSARGLDWINEVRRALTPYATRPSVQELENRFRATITAA